LQDTSRRTQSETDFLSSHNIYRSEILLATELNLNEKAVFVQHSNNIADLSDSWSSFLRHRSFLEPKYIYMGRYWFFTDFADHWRKMAEKEMTHCPSVNVKNKPSPLTRLIFSDKII